MKGHFARDCKFKGKNFGIFKYFEKANMIKELVTDFIAMVSNVKIDMVTKVNIVDASKSQPNGG